MFLTPPGSRGHSAQDEQRIKRKILKVLRVASRGRFLTEPMSHRRIERRECVPWFDPSRWFSLPFYLASRFDAALWNSYHQRNYHADQQENRRNECSLFSSVSNLDREAQSRVITHAVYTALKKDLLETKKLIQNHPIAKEDTSENSISTILRKSLILQLLWQMHTHQTAGSNATIPLLEWGTARAEMKSLVLGQLEESFSLEVKRNLLEILDKEGDSHRWNVDEAKKKKRKKKTPHKKNHETPPTIRDHNEDIIASAEDDDDDDDELEVECIIHKNHETEAGGIDINNPLAYADKMCSLNNGNDAKISVLVVIDEIIHKVFQRHRQDEKVVADDSDKATTTVVSNKESVNAAMAFLKRQDDDRTSTKSSMQSPHLWALRSKRQPTASAEACIARSKSGESLSLSPPRCGNHRVLSVADLKDDHQLESSEHSHLFPEISKDETSIFDGSPSAYGWNGVASSQQNPSNIFSEFLEGDQRSTEANIAASSTVASFASSEAGDPGLDIDGACGDFPSPTESNKAVHFESFGNKTPSDEYFAAGNVSSDEIPIQQASKSDSPVSTERITTPPPPPTPPPQLSPILVSLADLGKLRREAAAIELQYSPKESPPQLSSGISLPDSSVVVSAPLTRNFSRDDLRSIDERRRPLRRDRDQHHSVGRPQVERVTRNVDALLSYRNVVAQSSVHRKHSHDGKQKVREDAHPLSTRNIKTTTTPRSNAWTPTDFPDLRSSVPSTHSFKEPIINKILHLDVACARSECALDGVDDASHCNVIPRAQTDDTMTKDGATTISSVRTPPEEEQFVTVKEERNSYRDLCLTLGAENAKLRNLLASKMCAPFHTPSHFSPQQINPYYYTNPSFEFPFGAGYHAGSFHPVVAMSDAGVHRGEHESSVRSEDGTDMYPSVIGMSETQNSVSWQARGDSVRSACRRNSGGGTYAESDTSLDHHPGGQESHAFSAFRHINNQDSFFGPIPLHGMQSRLSKDMHHFMQALKTQLKRNESRRVWVVEQITKAVTALWPRAQVKMYGSHMTRLCLPSSDMDFVICLPAVHKNAPAKAPGDLEGRNAINETNQKVLSRKLKGESWLDQRSIKVIERTAVPVIKVSTKDSRSRVIQLDLSFDAKEHHGLEALAMIQHILEELPMIRPLVLVLKQFLLDRGLLTAYTGGLSSYCLFLMVARYCQEQSPTWNDCGSLLMGLLDFYGNFFDPRTTGISVHKRQYFSRSQHIPHTQSLSTQFYNDEQGWNMPPPPQQHQYTDLTRRNSFSDKSFGSAGKSGPKPPRFQPLSRQFSFQSQYHAHPPQSQVNSLDQSRTYQSGKPYTFDPIWVEDPLNPGNNVGRNAFRIFQVQRAFSDAHRALVAALEWDINSMHEGDDGEYPLLKCLLQNEDVFFDNIRD
ncbi:hypothetical protein HJC23_007083 [Cyclotella cryptica]|uniref:Polymerase nucleotidyl transferase domain-containing protein n=1 Tax=Cyclotella cryptica TaxID=29204 RepID=A0ABD3NX27_9STRA